MNKRMSVIKYVSLYFVSMHLSLQLMKNVLIFLCLYKYAALYVSWGMYV